ncbi:MAG: Hsp20/alpha crystallin family protein [Acidobacteria bacterium]|nr:Hsp20/alpha crystallin family protein [Acidobacteriota bacterium]
MAFSRWDPLHDLLALHERLNRLGAEEVPGWTPAVDLFETADRFVVSVELPSLNRDDIRIDVQEHTLVVRGERPCQTPGDARFLRVERGHGAFVRSFALPQPVRAAGVSAEFRDGVLTILVPKVQPQIRRIKID